MSISLTCRPSVTQQVTQSVRLTQSQRAIVKQTILGLRLALIGNIHGGSYKPQAKCPKCARTLTPLEIIQGFRSDPNDYTTECTSCNTRFEPRLVWRESNSPSHAELPFYCPTQVLAQLRGFEGKTPDEINHEAPAVYHSVRVHHGNLRRAFAKIGIQYAFENVTNWQEKVRDFLGKLPDTVIAEVVDLPVRTVRNLRNSHGIRPFSRRDLLREA